MSDTLTSTYAHTCMQTISEIEKEVKSIVGASLIVIGLCRHMAMGKQLYRLIMILSDNFLVNYVHHV